MANNIKKDALSSYTNLLITIVAGFIAVPIIENSVGKSYFGIYQFVFSLAAYSELMGLGLGKTVERYVSEYAVQKKSDRESLIVSMVISIYIIACMIFFAAAFILYINFADIFNFTQNELSLARACFMIAAINGALNIPASVFQSFLRGRGKYSFVFNTGTIQVIARIFLVTFFINKGYGIFSIFLIDLILFQAANIFFAISAVKRYGIKIRLFDFERELFINLLKFSAFVFLGGIAETLYWSTDNIILGIYTSSAVIAEYALSQRLINYFYRYGTAFSGLFLPSIMEHHHGEDEQESNKKIVDLFTSASRHQGIITSFAVVNFIVLGAHFIRLWVGDNYSMTYVYTIIILLPFWMVLTQATGVEVLYVMKKHKVNTMIYLINAIINIIFTVILVQRIGPIGAAIATSVTMFIGSVVLSLLYYRNLLKMSMRKYLTRVYARNLTASAAVLLYGYGLNFFLPDHGIGSFMLKAGLLNILWIPVILMFLLSSSDKNSLSRFVNRKKIV